ncbi:helix-turn-helix domain-containing protein [Leptotrichia hofstadii]|jgi:ISSth1, transposase, IS3 family|uniref:Transposase n=1 Tax=Leptotrichia hofstadii F0254 TaxID=634994 RepID=C9MX78_9FUSO|nr:helix-turn-helix domain-containing protein [Leptotrichia hofstadii]EEX75094.1 transposase [Leptotrichia hofstadii F0254]
MGRKSKVSNELKIELVKKVLDGKATIQGLAKEYGIAKSSIMTWKKKYLELGEESIVVGDKNRHYTRELREKAIKSYLNNEGSLFDICKKYDIASVSVLNYWIRDYRRSVDANGNYTVIKKHVRKTIEAKVEAVTFCLNNNYDYNQTIRKFGVSYQQIYSWVKKYEKGGVDALVDNRGKRTSSRKTIITENK